MATVGVLAALVVSGVAMTSVLGPAGVGRGGPGAGNGGPGVARGTQPPRAYDSALAVAARSAHSGSAPTAVAIGPSEGPSTGGTLVAISAWNLGGATAVYFGGVPATQVTVVSDTLVTAVSPPDTGNLSPGPGGLVVGTVDVSVVTPNGTTPDSIADRFTYYVIPTNTTLLPPTATSPLCPTPVPVTAPPGNLTEAAAMDIFNRINLERAARCPTVAIQSKGADYIPQLTWNDSLANCAVIEAQGEVALGQVADAPVGCSVDPSLGRGGGNDGEASDTAEMDEGYMQSTPHRANMLAASMTMGAVGVACFHGALGWLLMSDEEFAVSNADPAPLNAGYAESQYLGIPLAQDPIVAGWGTGTPMTADQVCDPGAPTTTSTPPPTSTTIAQGPLAPASYRLISSDGSAKSFAPPPTGVSSLPGTGGPVVAAAATPSGAGYWEVTDSGAVYPFGDATAIASPIVAGGKWVVGIVATPDGKGYWLATSDGDVYPAGDATSLGSMAGKPLNKPIVGMAATPSGAGYWLVAADGGIFAFGDAGFYGSTGAMRLNQPVVGMATTPDGKGYWLVAEDGGIFTFGDAPFEGSSGGGRITLAVVGMVG